MNSAKLFPMDLMEVKGVIGRSLGGPLCPCFRGASYMDESEQDLSILDLS